MTSKREFALMLIAGIIVLYTQISSAQESTSQRQPVRLAVLNLNYDAFSDEEKENVNKSLYDYLARDDRISVMTATEARKNLIPLGIEPSEIANEQGYIAAGRILEVDYILVGNMDKIGDFVEVTFRTFKMPRGTQKRYPGGKTLDMLVREEIPNIVNLIYDDMGLQEQVSEDEIESSPEPEGSKVTEITGQTKVGKKLPWAMIALGSVAGGAAAFFLASSGGEDQNGPVTSQSALPRPPTVP